MTRDVSEKKVMLAVDVGNTHITSAVIDGAEIRLMLRIPTETCLKSGAFFEHLDFGGDPVPGQIVLCSVRKSVSGIICRECEDLPGVTPLIVTNDTPMGITSRYRSKATLGTDRLVDAAACFHLHAKGRRPGIVIDMGTATTIDYITGEGEYLGGVIAPGLLSAYRGLTAAAPELPEVEISPVDRLIGTTTHECIRSGAVAGHAALVKELSSMMAREHGSTPVVVVTGGFSRMVNAWLPEEYIRDEHLMLKGLSFIYQVNSKNY